MRENTQSGKLPSRSHSSAFGASSFSTNWRIDFRRASWSSVNSGCAMSGSTSFHGRVDEDEGGSEERRREEQERVEAAEGRDVGRPVAEEDGGGEGADRRQHHGEAANDERTEPAERWD